MHASFRSLIFILPLILCQSSPAADSKPNVLVIAIDDLNDWLGCFGGHPQVKTPNIDRLAQRGIMFSNAHCAAPLCNPSRAALFSGRHPYETGVYANDESDIRQLRPDLVLLPQHFKQSGYLTAGTGKLLHQKGAGMYDAEFFPEQRWSPFDPKQTNYTNEDLPTKGTDHPRHVTELKGRQVVLPLNQMPSDRAAQKFAGESFDWGPLDVDDSDMGDGQIADWAAERLKKAYAGPFYFAVGFYRPHIPLFAPRKYFELYDGLEIKVPEVRPDDLEDLSPTGRQWAREPVTAGSHATVLKFGQWKAAVKGYLACISFVDAQVGKLLAALEAGPNANNTVIALWGDHGWHLGEKEHWGKWTGWRLATRVPLIIVPPAEAKMPANATCSGPVSLLDLYPTLIELCGLPPREGLSGQSLVPLLRDPRQFTGRVVITTFDRGNYALSGPRWRYIHYADGSEELYDIASDPNEWTNVAALPGNAGVITEFRQRLPSKS